MSSEAKRLSCDICNKQFKFSSTYKIHLNKHDRALNKTDNPTKRSSAGGGQSRGYLPFHTNDALLKSADVDNKKKWENKIEHERGDISLIGSKIDSPDPEQVSYKADIRGHYQTNYRLLSSTCNNDLIGSVAADSHATRNKVPKSSCPVISDNLQKECNFADRSPSSDIADNLCQTESNQMEDLEVMQSKALNDKHKLGKQTDRKKTKKVKGQKRKVKYELKQPHACKICQKVFSRRQNLLTHKDKHRGLRYKCELCGLTYSTKYSLKTHQLWHKNKKPWKCKECGAQFLQNGHFKRHLKIHTDQRDEICEQCGKSFRNKDGLRSHKETHTETVDHECTVCGIRLKLKSSLRNHMKIHKDGKQFVCKICKREFTQKKSYLDHKKLHRNNNSKRKAYLAQTSEFCSLCNKGFVDHAGLKQHMRKHELGLLKRFNSLKLRETSKSDDNSVKMIGSHAHGSQLGPRIDRIPVHVTDKRSCELRSLQTETTLKAHSFDVSFHKNDVTETTLRSIHAGSSEDKHLLHCFDNSLAYKDSVVSNNKDSVHLVRSDTEMKQLINSSIKHGHGVCQNQAGSAQNCFSVIDGVAQNKFNTAILPSASFIADGQKALVSRLDLPDINGYESNGNDKTKVVENVNLPVGDTGTTDMTVVSRDQTMCLAAYGKDKDSREHNNVCDPVVDSRDKYMYVTDQETEPSLSSLQTGLHTTQAVLKQEGTQNFSLMSLCQITSDIRQNATMESSNLEHDFRFLVKNQTANEITESGHDNAYHVKQLDHQSHSECTLDEEDENTSETSKLHCFGIDAITESQTNSLTVKQSGNFSTNEGFKQSSKTTENQTEYSIKILPSTYVSHTNSSCNRNLTTLDDKSTYRCPTTGIDSDSLHSNSDDTEISSENELTEHVSKSCTNLSKAPNQTVANCCRFMKSEDQTVMETVHMDDGVSNRDLPFKNICKDMKKKGKSLKNKKKKDPCQSKAICEHCGKEFSQVCHLNRHLRKKGCVKLFLCSLCSKAFRTGRNLKSHLEKDHSFRYSCRLCDRSYASASLLNKHQKHHVAGSPCLYVPKPFQCKICGKKYTASSSLKNHILQHKGYTFPCTICGKEYGQKSHLNRHFRTIHNGVRPYKCDVDGCNKAFIDTRALKVHKRSHSGEKPFQCSQCGKCFSVNQNLNVHMRKHQNIKQFECDICHQQFTTKMSLLRHAKRHTLETTLGGANGKKSCKKRPVKKMAEKCLTCTQGCGRRFTTKRSLLAHMKRFCPAITRTFVDDANR